MNDGSKYRLNIAFEPKNIFVQKTILILNLYSVFCFYFILFYGSTSLIDGGQMIRYRKIVTNGIGGERNCIW